MPTVLYSHAEKVRASLEIYSVAAKPDLAATE